MRAAILALVLLLFSGTANALSPIEEKITSALSDEDVPISATFTGREILVFGAIERSRFFDPKSDSLPDVIIVISGPVEELKIRRKGRKNGIWTQTASADASAPTYKAIASTKPVPELLGAPQIAAHRVALKNSVQFADGVKSVERADYLKALVTLRTEAGLFREQPRGVKFLSSTLFKAEVGIPPNIVQGEYSVRTMLVREGRVIDTQPSVIYVHKDEFGKAIETTSQKRPLVFGLLAVLLALVTGLVTAEIFRLVRR